ncbi:hypothetical protein [Aliiroseovarius crassostreae]|uniref:hypothetical protein n=1 Tax=Aliiroseovarius crassostreae TaxID=154981 RepID=UPI00220F2CC5|nr:hypothetical protein [Aliiroseovarius crassostreae]UWP99746.1 hypothetical protein K3X53_06355 [Aliiroseovarius crassostreae]
MAGLEIGLAQARSRHGVFRFRVSLIENSSSNAGDIPSEREYRCVALAGFMAELSIKDCGSGIIIFDDPMSSLNPVEPTPDDRDREFDALQNWRSTLAQYRDTIYA